MKKYLLFILTALAFWNQANADMKLAVMLEPAQTDSLTFMELPSLGLAVKLGGDSLLVVGAETMAPLHIPAYEGATNLIATDSTMYCSEGHFIYAITSDGMDRTEVGVLDNEQFSLFPATGTSFLVVSSDELHADCLLFDPVASVYSEVMSINAPIFKAVANDEHLLVWAGNHILTIGNGGQAASIFTDDSIRDMVLTPSGLIVATDQGLLLFTSLVDAKVLYELPVQRLWYIDETLYLLTDNGYLLALYDE